MECLLTRRLWVKMLMRKVMALCHDHELCAAFQLADQMVEHPPTILATARKDAREACYDGFANVATCRRNSTPMSKTTHRGSLPTMSKTKPMHVERATTLRCGSCCEIRVVNEDRAEEGDLGTSTVGPLWRVEPCRFCC